MFRAFFFLLLSVLALGTTHAQSDNIFVANANTGDIVRVSYGSTITPFAHVDELIGVSAVGMAVDAQHYVYVSVPDRSASASPNSYLIYKIDPTGKTTVFARGLIQLGMLAFDSHGTLFAGIAGAFYKISPAGTVIKMPANVPTPTGMAFAANGTLFVANVADGTVVKVNPDTGVVAPFASGMNHPEGIAFDTANNLYVADIYDNTIFRVSPAGLVTPITQLTEPRSLAFDLQGNLYVSSENINSLLKLDHFGSTTLTLRAFSKPLNLAFNRPLLKITPPSIPTPTENKLPIGLMIACSIPAIILIIGFIVWGFFREKKEDA